MTEAVETAPPAPFAERVREFFTLESATREARALPPGPRATARRALAIAYQKREAAETLWPRGSSAEALHLARASVDTAAGALASFESANETEPGAPSRADWVATARAIASDAQQKVAGRALPEIENDATAEDEETFRTLVDASMAIERLATPHLAGESELKQTQRARIATTALATIAFVGALAWLLHTPDFRSAATSAITVGEDGADKAIDGDTKTDWYPPTGQLPWLELTLGKAKRVRGLHVLATNPPWNDRGVKDAHVKCFLGGDVVKEVDTTFPVPPPRNTPNGVWGDVALDAPKCDRVLIETKSFYGQGIGIAEVELK